MVASSAPGGQISFGRKIKHVNCCLSALPGIAALVASGAASADLMSFGTTLVYDTDLNITWLANANLAASETFGVAGINANGSMTWDVAQSWIGAMNANSYLGYSNWRLPLTLNPDPSCGNPTNSTGSGCSGSEMGHQYYVELSGSAGNPVSASGDPDLGLFQNIMENIGGNVATYWSGTTFINASQAWAFSFNDGNQSAAGKTQNQFFAWAVLPGAPVPVPATAWLFGSGLIGFAWARRGSRNREAV